MELIKYKSIIEVDFEEYEAPSDTINHEATVYSPYGGPFSFLFAPYWVEHIENDTYYYYDARYYESGVIITTIDRYKYKDGSSLEGLLNFASEHSDKQIIKSKATNSLLMREHEYEGEYSISHWKLAAKIGDDYVVLNLSHFPLRPEEMPEDVYEKYKWGIADLIHEIDYMLVHAKINSH